MSGHSHFDESVEEYLESIYRLEYEGPGVTTSGLASAMGVTPASASGMLKKLDKEGYVSYVARGEVKLTRKGLEVGVRILRRHRLAERLLTDILGMPWDEVNAEACMLEHAISQRVEDRLVTLLGDPQTCPHGHPVPSRDLREPVRTGVPLAQVDAGREAVVSGVTDGVPEILRYLGEVGLCPGAQVRILEKAPLGGPVTIEVDSVRHAISLELARMVVVGEDAVA